MSYLTNTICQECGNEFLVICNEVRIHAQTKVAADIEDAAHFHMPDQMTIDQRMGELEEVSYRRSKAKPVHVPSPLIGGAS